MCYCLGGVEFSMCFCNYPEFLRGATEVTHKSFQFKCVEKSKIFCLHFLNKEFLLVSLQLDGGAFAPSDVPHDDGVV